MILQAKKVAKPTAATVTLQWPVQFCTTSEPKNNAIEQALDECVDGKPYSR